MSFIALDWGQRFVGYASADPQGLVITPRKHFERRATTENTWKLSKADIQSLQKIIEEWEVERFILGLPLKANGDESEASQGARLLKTQIQEHFKLEVVLVDERLTSWESKGSNNHAGAAALIMQNYFRSLSGKAEEHS
jgi:putative Holliday junction resolvase